ncbi:hypothetical protein CEXT_550921 [Caerostris extrusa]|uniref:Uncharacterized protein n=1 Tax=Caerostris extrusa TaxID=172846 RepID=A0AAV4U3R1_CAEEX|nr:hypothetical protein CEXT_550921 [Caerostris extrusa]
MKPKPITNIEIAQENLNGKKGIVVIERSLIGDVAELWPFIREILLLSNVILRKTEPPGLLLKQPRNNPFRTNIVAQISWFLLLPGARQHQLRRRRNSKRLIKQCDNKLFLNL